MKLAILGAGPGGYVAAIKAAQLRAQVTVIEDTEVGGTCLNRGCLPTKALLASSELLAKTRELESYGIQLRGETVPNLSKIVERKDKIVNIQVKGIRSLFKSWGIILKEGRGVLISPSEIKVSLKDGSEEKLKADKIIIATGSRPAQIPTLPFDGKKIISSNEAIEPTELPKSLLIIGAGAIGCEFACIYRELGTDVTMVEMLPRVLPLEDIEISELFARELKKKKIKVYTDMKVERVDTKSDGVRAVLSDATEIVAEKLLVSVGRVLNSDGIGIEALGINKGPRDEIIVNEKMETNVPGVSAIGDVIGGFLFAHVASTEGKVAAMNIMGGNERIDYNAVPYAVFTSPEIASVGLREQQAMEKGIKVRTGHFQFRALGKAHAMGEITGFIKLVSDATSDKLLGAHIIGPHASDLIHEATLALKAGLRTKDIAETIHSHPTLSEGLMEAAEDARGKAIHAVRRQG